MTQSLITRYQPGGDIYNAISAKYGQAAADATAQAALSGDETQINAALTTAIYGQPLPTSTATIFVDNMATNPLGAPLSGLDTILTNTLNSLLTNKTVLLIGAGTVFFVWFDGMEKIKRLIKK